MDKEKFEWEQEILNEELREDIREEKRHIAKCKKLHEEPDSITEWSEWQSFNTAATEFKAFCIMHDLEFEEEVKHVIGNL